MPKTIGIIGARSRDTATAFSKVFNAFRKIYEEGDCVCSGKCPKGGDRFAEIIADIYRLPRKKRKWFPPDWNKYGRMAAFVRNTDIAKASDILIACVSASRKGGTEDTIEKWKKSGSDSDLYLV